MPGYYNDSSCSIKKNGQDEVELCHNHGKAIMFEHFKFRDRDLLKRMIGSEKALIKGCISFFKTYAEDKTIPVELRAAATAAVNEDEQRLKEYTKNEPSRCSIQ